MLNKDVVLELSNVCDLLAPSLQEPYRKVLQFYAQNHAPWYCFNIHFFVQRFLETTDARGFSLTAIKKYRAFLRPTDEWRLASIRSFLLCWHDQGHFGVSQEAAQWLRSQRLKGNTKGRAVLSMDPNHGPFTDQELGAILTAAPQEYERGRINLETLAFVLLLAFTGRRSGQLTLLRLGDLYRTTAKDGRPVDVVRIPRTKQRGQVPRAQFKSFWLPTEVYCALDAQRNAVIKDAERWFGRLPGNITSELPLFPSWLTIARLRSIEQLELALRNDGLHARTANMGQALKRIRVRSDRTGRRLHISPQRFRYTVATRAAREGYGALVIAELLDHSDTQNTWVYTRGHPNFRGKVDAAVEKQLAPIASAFAGKLVDTECYARHGKDPRMRVGTRREKVGTCASTGGCGAAPLACYTCMHFQAWVDAPHQKMLESMLNHQRDLKAAGAAPVVVGALDSSIAAARAVIKACEVRAAELRRSTECHA